MAYYYAGIQAGEAATDIHTLVDLVAPRMSLQPELWARYLCGHGERRRAGHQQTRHRSLPMVRRYI